MIAKVALGLSVGTLIGVVVMAVGFGAKVQHQAGQALDEQDVQCERGNLRAADRILDTRQPDDDGRERARVETLYPILDCGTRPRKPLPAASALVYVRFVARCRVPVVQGHAVIGARPGRCQRTLKP